VHLSDPVKDQDCSGSFTDEKFFHPTISLQEESMSELLDTLLGLASPLFLAAVKKKGAKKPAKKKMAMKKKPAKKAAKKRAAPKKKMAPQPAPMMPPKPAPMPMMPPPPPPPPMPPTNPMMPGS